MTRASSPRSCALGGVASPGTFAEMIGGSEAAMVAQTAAIARAPARGQLAKGLSVRLTVHGCRSDGARHLPNADSARQRQTRRGLRGDADAGVSTFGVRVDSDHSVAEPTRRRAGWFSGAWLRFISTLTPKCATCGARERGT